MNIRNIRKLRLNDAESAQSSEERDEFEKDYARLIQSPAFRRRVFRRRGPRGGGAAAEARRDVPEEGTS